MDTGSADSLTCSACFAAAAATKQRPAVRPSGRRCRRAGACCGCWPKVGGWVGGSVGRWVWRRCWNQPTGKRGWCCWKERGLQRQGTALLPRPCLRVPHLPPRVGPCCRAEGGRTFRHEVGTGWLAAVEAAGEAAHALRGAVTRWVFCSGTQRLPGRPARRVSVQGALWQGDCIRGPRASGLAHCCALPCLQPPLPLQRRARPCGRGRRFRAGQAAARNGGGAGGSRRAVHRHGAGLGGDAPPAARDAAERAAPLQVGQGCGGGLVWLERLAAPAGSCRPARSATRAPRQPHAMPAAVRPLAGSCSCGRAPYRCSACCWKACCATAWPTDGRRPRWQARVGRPQGPARVSGCACAKPRLLAVHLLPFSPRSPSIPPHRCLPAEGLKMETASRPPPLAASPAPDPSAAAPAEPGSAAPAPTARRSKKGRAAAAKPANAAPDAEAEASAGGGGVGE